MVTSMYIVVGLAILAMSFDLMKDSMVDKFEWFVLFFLFLESFVFTILFK